MYWHIYTSAAVLKMKGCSQDSQCGLRRMEITCDHLNKKRLNPHTQEVYIDKYKPINLG